MVAIESNIDPDWNLDQAESEDSAEVDPGTNVLTRRITITGSLVQIMHELHVIKRRLAARSSPTLSA